MGAVTGGSEQRQLGGLEAVVGLPGGLGEVEFGDLGDRDVPPAVATGRLVLQVGVDVHQDGGLGRLGLGQRVLQLDQRRGLEHLDPEAGRVGRQVDRQDAAVQPPGLAVAVPVLGAEPLHAKGFGQRADRGVAVVLQQHHDDLDALLDRGDQFGRHHQVGAVADGDEDVPVRCGHPDADPAGDLVSHAGEAVFDVVALAVPGPPHAVQVTRQGAGRADDDVPGLHHLVDRAEHLGLGEQRRSARRSRSGRTRRPRRPRPWPSPAPPAGTQRRSNSRPAAAVSASSVRLASACTGSPAVLDGVDRGDVDVDELDVRVLEDRPGRGGEIRVPGADPDDDVRLPGEQVRRRVPGGADRAQVQRVVERQRALAGLGFGDRDAGGLDELLQRLVGLGVGDAAAGDDHRLAGAANDLGDGVEHLGLGDRPDDPPHPLLEQVDGPVVGLGLHVLRQRDGRGTGLGRIGQHPHRAQQCGRQLLGPPHPVEEPGHRTERVVDRDVVPVRLFQLLQHRRGDPGGEDVAGQQQHRAAG